MSFELRAFAFPPAHPILRRWSSPRSIVLSDADYDPSADIYIALSIRNGPVNNGQIHLYMPGYAGRELIDKRGGGDLFLAFSDVGECRKVGKGCCVMDGCRTDTVTRFLYYCGRWEMIGSY
ncbi:hypothetical protein Trydic_g19629 [Trypoxylus dichotomus]